MTAALHRWATVAIVVLTLVGAAMRRNRRARFLRKMARRMEVWPW